MTLIISCMTHNYVVQVSDRRLTSLDGSQAEANKATIFRQRMAFGYTGLAKLPDKNGREIDTDIWLTNTLFDLQSLPLKHVCLGIASAATDAFKNKPIKIQLAGKVFPILHAFVGIGWVRDATDLQPLLVVISNYHDDLGNPIDTPRREFRLFARQLRTKEKSHVEFIGISLRRQDSKYWGKVRSLIRTRVKNNKDSSEIANVLVNSMRNVATFYPTVSSNLMVINMSREAIEAESKEKRASASNEWMLFNKPPSDDAISCFYVPADRNDLIGYTPNIVNGQAFIKGKFFSYDKESGTE